MTFNYAASAATAARLLANFGQTVTLTRTAPGAYDPVTGTTAADTVSTRTAKAVLLDYTLQDSGAQLADGSTIRVGDKKCLIEPGGPWAPDELTTVTDAGGTVWRIDNIRVLAPAGTPVLYTARAQR